MRRMQMYNLYGTACRYTGSSPFDLQFLPGLLPNTDWVDYTDSTDGLLKTTFTFSVQQSDQGSLDVGSFTPKKSIGSPLIFEGAAYDQLKQWLVDDIAGPLNRIEVKYLDTSCGEYTGYYIDAQMLSWCEYDTACTYSCTPKQNDELIKCIQKTLIADNWQGWFQTVPLNGKKHPRFSYCVEHRPNGMLTLGWWLLSVTIFITMGVLLPILFVFTIIDGILITINGILSVFSGNPIGLLPSIFDIQNIQDSLLQMYVESAGCGREHPAPLIKDYITNVCDKCAVQVDSITCPIFFAPYLTLTKSDGIQYTIQNPYVNATYFFPSIKRGIRRFLGINIFNGPTANDTDFYDADNAPLLSLDMLLDQLKGVWNSAWRVQNGKLYFWRKDWYLDASPLYDMSQNSADRLKILEGICYEIGEVSNPVFLNGFYSDDPADKCGHEAAQPMNGDPISFDLTDRNPTFEGELVKRVQFGATKFCLDGASTDYVYDAMEVICNGSLVFQFLIAQMSTLSGWIQKYHDYALLLQGETVSLPKILIWDGINYMNAFAVCEQTVVNGTNYYVGKYAVPSSGLVTTPEINPLYPFETLAAPPIFETPFTQPWEQAHPPDAFVIGSSLTGGSDFGYYEVNGNFGIQILKNIAKLVNYPMYFEPHFKDSLWDLFHWIDDPKRYPHLNRKWKFKIPLCCEDLQKCGVLADATAAKLMDTVKLDSTYGLKGIIKQIEVSYDNGDSGDTGKYIEISGDV